MYRPHHHAGGALAATGAATGNQTFQILLLALVLFVGGVLLLRVSRLRKND